MKFKHNQVAGPISENDKDGRKKDIFRLKFLIICDISITTTNSQNTQKDKSEIQQEARIPSPAPAELKNVVLRFTKSAIRLLSPTISADRCCAVQELVGVVFVFDGKELSIVGAIECRLEIGLEGVSLGDT
jgi:hypothetical protein